MEDKIKYELNELMKKDRIETEEAVNYLKKVNDCRAILQQLYRYLIVQQLTPQDLMNQIPA